jgi:hypothetical protein
MAKRFLAGAFVLFASLLLAPIAADARGMSGGRGVSGGFRGLPAARVHVGARSSVRGGARHVSFGRHGFRPPAFGPRSIFGNRLGRVGDRYHRGHNGRRYGYGFGGYGFDTYGADAFSYGSPAVTYVVPTAAQSPAEPLEVTGGNGGPLLLRHICESEVQVVPATGGGDTEVTITRCRLYAEYPRQ